MFIVFEDRPSDSPLVERVWRSHSESAGTFYSMAACHWEMVVSRHQGQTLLTVRGPETKATMADCPDGGEWFGVCFKLGTFMPQLRPAELRDRNDVTLPGATRWSFWLDGAAWEYPDYENADTFIDRLTRRGLIAADPYVIDALGHRSADTTARTTQRHFVHTTGITQTAAHQIERARFATRLLREGVPILDVVHRAGYYDQAHLSRSLKYLVGQTPGQIARAEQQLSFLYNTTFAELATV